MRTKRDNSGALQKHCVVCGCEFEVSPDKHWARMCLQCWIEQKIADKHEARKSTPWKPQESEWIKPNHDYPLWSRIDIAPWDESLGEFSYT